MHAVLRRSSLDCMCECDLEPHAITEIRQGSCVAVRGVKEGGEGDDAEQCVQECARVWRVCDDGACLHARECCESVRAREYGESVHALNVRVFGECS